MAVKKRSPKRVAVQTPPATGAGAGLTMRVRALGRMCFVAGKPIGKSGTTFDRLQVIGVRMDKNPLLKLEHHFMTLTVPLACIHFHTRRPDFTTFSNHEDPEAIEEYYVWNLAACDVTISGLQSGSVTVEEVKGKHEFARPEGLATPKPVLAADVEGDRLQSAADCVLTLDVGTLRPLSALAPRPIQYFPLDPGRPKPRGIPGQKIAEGAEILVPASGPQLTLNIHRRTDDAKWSITLEKDRVVRKNPIVTLGNTCGCIVNSTGVVRDVEFAAYYELLSDPGSVEDRLIPVTDPNFISSGACDSPALF